MAFAGHGVSGHGGGGLSGPIRDPDGDDSGKSSKSRYRAYLRRRERDAQAKKTAKIERLGKEGTGVGGRPLGDDDPNSPRRVKRSRSFWVLLREFWGMIEGHRVTVAMCVGTVTIAALVALAAPASPKIAIDYILTVPPKPMPAWVPEWFRDKSAMQRLLLLAAMLMGLTSIAILSGIWGRYQMTRMTQITRASVRRRVFNHTVRLPLHRVYELKSGGAASILREDAGQAADLLFSMMYNPWRAIVQLIGTLIVIAIWDWRILVGAIALLPAAYFTQRAWIGRIRPLFREVRNTRTMIDSHATEAFGGMRVVRGFVRQRAEAARFIRNNHLMAREELLAWWWSRGIEIVWQFLLPLGSVGMLIYCGNRVWNGTMTLGDMMMLSTYLIMLLGPLESLSASATGIQAELASLDRILDLLAEPAEFEGGSEGKVGSGKGEGESSENGSAFHLSTSPFPLSARIVIEHLSFKYPKGQEWVLREIDLDVRAGSTVALVGPSGAGKTTLCNLVARFYDPTEGRILLDGRDIREIPVDSYRSLLGIVEQDVFLFDGTVRENIGYARRGVGMSEIRAAARAANADGFIEKLEKGYETLIGERGVRLSGGQKQRIAIARAILARPRILILDEATSNLDTESEHLIQESLRTLMRGGDGQGSPPTSFVIAHRLSTIRHADLIVVIDHGRIIERGSHAELIAQQGRYWQMLERQMTSREDQAAAVQEGTGTGSKV
jgi:ATP-binding cassette subfamily B protein/subfamily B ATP-binding cassette protein MsbA